MEIEKGILQDYCNTLQSMFDADALAMVDLEDFQLFFWSSTTSASADEVDIVSVMAGFIMGDPCPPDIELIIHPHDSKHGSPSLMQPSSY